MIRYWNGKRRVEYVCRGYHRNGKSYCTSHRIHEESINAAVRDYTVTMRKYAPEQEVDEIVTEKLQKELAND